MTTQSTERDILHQRLRILLPETYRDREDVKPISMGSAGLKYGADGLVAWDDIWRSFCDLAMAGGPPHRGTLLAPGTPDEIAASPELYNAVTREICRGLHLVTGLFAEPADPGCIRLYCTSAAMSGWLARAIVMENVWANISGLQLLLPAAPHYRVEKEIKNVITSVAKTCHYWTDHTTHQQQLEIASLFTQMEQESPGIQPTMHEGWLAIPGVDVPSAIALMRALSACNLFPRREDTTVFVPINTSADPDGKRTVQAITRAQRYISEAT